MTMTLKPGQRIKLRADAAEGWDEEVAEYVGRSGNALMVRVEPAYLDGPNDDGLREVTEDQLELYDAGLCVICDHTRELHELPFSETSHPFTPKRDR